MLNLVGSDRCDRCGAQAVARATHAGLEDLLFCGHHLREHHDALMDQYWLIEEDVTHEYIDKTVALTEG